MNGMNLNDSVRIRKYYGLRISAGVLKMMALIAVFFVLGGFGWLTVEALSMGGASQGAFQYWWLPRVLSLVLLGFLFGLFCLALAQLIDAQVEQAENMRQMSENMTKITEQLKLLRFERTMRNTDGVNVPVRANAPKE